MSQYDIEMSSLRLPGIYVVCLKCTFVYSDLELDIKQQLNMKSYVSKFNPSWDKPWTWIYVVNLKNQSKLSKRVIFH